MDKNGLSAFLLGLGVGVGIGMLFAPKSGQQTRKLIAKRAGEGKDFVTTKGREFMEQAGERIADTFEAGKVAARNTFLRQ